MVLLPEWRGVVLKPSVMHFLSKCILRYLGKGAKTMRLFMLEIIRNSCRDLIYILKENIQDNSQTCDCDIYPSKRKHE